MSFMLCFGWVDSSLTHTFKHSRKNVLEEVSTSLQGFVFNSIGQAIASRANRNHL